MCSILKLFHFQHRRLWILNINSTFLPLPVVQAYRDMFSHSYAFKSPAIPGWSPDTNPWDDYLYPPFKSGESRRRTGTALETKYKMQRERLSRCLDVISDIILRQTHSRAPDKRQPRDEWVVHHFHHYTAVSEVSEGGRQRRSRLR